MKILRFRAYTAPDPETAPTVLELAILPADRMRAERASTAELPPSQRGPEAVKAHPESWVLLWLWCSATRQGHTTARFSEWADTVLDWDRVNADGTPATDHDDDELEADAELGPTPPGGPTSGP